MDRRHMIAAIIVGAFALPKKSFAQDTANVPVRPNVGSIAERNVKELLLLMDTNKNGKISKKEWMDFRSAEFDRLDTDKSGELDPKELAQSRLVVGHVNSETMGK
jgi:Ca2+-binding EF-hand superfamily protein